MWGSFSQIPDHIVKKKTHGIKPGQPGVCTAVATGHSFFKKHIPSDHIWFYESKEMDRNTMNVKNVKKSWLSPLQKHEREHTGEQSSECKQSGKTFRSSRSIQLCEKTHTGEKPYEGEQRGKMFTYPNSIRRHRVLPSGDWPYECKACGKGFLHPYCLWNYEAPHTEEKPGECEQYDSSSLNT